MHAHHVASIKNVVRHFRRIPEDAHFDQRRRSGERQVAERGSEPARFAFQDARVLFTRIPDLDSLVRAAARYPVESKTERMRRFRAQLDAWHWYAHEALRHTNHYLLTLSLSKPPEPARPDPQPPTGWGAQFMLDNELNWLSSAPPVDDL